MNGRDRLSIGGKQFQLLVFAVDFFVFDLSLAGRRLLSFRFGPTIPVDPA